MHGRNVAQDMKSDWLNDAQGAADDLEKALTSGIDPSNRVCQWPS